MQDPNSVALCGPRLLRHGFNCQVQSIAFVHSNIMRRYMVYVYTHLYLII